MKCTHVFVADEIVELRWDMNIKVATFTVNEKSINRNIGLIGRYIIEKRLSLWKLKNQLLSMDVLFVYSVKIEA